MKEQKFRERVQCGIAYCEDIATNEIEQDFKAQEEKHKQIEELAKDYYGYSIDLEEDCKFVAEEMYNKGHRKLTEDSVVLSREEYERLKDYTRIRIKPRNDVTSDYIRTLEMDNDGLLNRLKEERKKTAEKAYKDLKLLVPDNAVDIVTRYFKEIMDIEIK